MSLGFKDFNFFFLTNTQNNISNFANISYLFVLSTVISQIYELSYFISVALFSANPIVVNDWSACENKTNINAQLTMSDYDPSSHNSTTCLDSQSFAKIPPQVSTDFELKHGLYLYICVHHTSSHKTQLTCIAEDHRPLCILKRGPW